MCEFILHDQIDMDDGELIGEITNTLTDMVTSNKQVNGPLYIRKNKMLAVLYFEKGKYQESIYHLTESHSASLRNSALELYTSNEDYKPKLGENTPSYLNTELLSFNGPYYKMGPLGVLERLKQLPSEWTVVQLTFEYDEEETWYSVQEKSGPKMLPLHLTRMPCGELVNAGNFCPITVIVNEPKSVEDGMPTILDVVHSSIANFSKSGSSKEKSTSRTDADRKMKSISIEIITSWLKEWSCLLIGRLIDSKLQEMIVTTVDNALKKFSSSCRNLPDFKRAILYQIADCCAHLTEHDIRNGVEYCVEDKKCVMSLLGAILNLKQEQTHKLINAKRHPSILILDDNLEHVPWEMSPVLYKHPVSRVPSLHFLHAIHEKHKDKIENGVRIVEESEVGFFVVNPSKEFSITEKNLTKFLQRRRSSWLGVAGRPPTDKQLLTGLTEANVFLFSGHGNCSQYKSGEDIQKIDLTVVPLLFGCSSVSKRKIGEGGTSELWGVSHHFLLAGSPCMFGMLWNVTNIDTDRLNMVFLNTCLPGTPVDINEFVEADVEIIKRPELELLRALKPARSSADRFMNGAAFVARGIPLAFKE